MKKALFTLALAMVFAGAAQSQDDKKMMKHAKMKGDTTHMKMHKTMKHTTVHKKTTTKTTSPNP